MSTNQISDSTAQKLFKMLDYFIGVHSSGEAHMTDEQKALFLANRSTAEKYCLEHYKMKLNLRGAVLYFSKD